MVVYYIDGDLFSAPSDYSLAHCIAVDARMAGGIAIPFKQKFKQQSKILSYLEKVDESKQIGSVVPLKYKSIYIYNLITKQYSSGKPKLADLKKSLKHMKMHMIENNITKVAMPKIGAGIDRLDWNDVIIIICDLFQDKKFKILIYCL